MNKSPLTASLTILFVAMMPLLNCKKTKQPPGADAAIRLRMADIETRLACGATSNETIYVHQDGKPEPESMSLAPCILLSDSGPVLLATPHHPLAHGVDSVRALCGSEKATISHRAGTGADDFLADSGFSSVILNVVKDEQVSVRLYGDSTFVEFSMPGHERRAWREMAYYYSNFCHRTPALPDTARLPHISHAFGDMSNAPDRSEIELAKRARSMPIPDPAPFWRLDAMPRPINIPAPYYPNKLKTDDPAPSAVVETLLDTMGRARTAVLLKPTGNSLLDLAAVRAALDASFTPPRLRHKPARTWVELPYVFRRH